MPTPSERLQKVIAARTPSEIVFKLLKASNEAVFLTAVVTKPSVCSVLLEDAELQAALNELVEERWDGDEGKYLVSVNVEQLWNKIKNDILREYEDVSSRCAATKRKTEQFIRDIKIEDKHLPNYLLTVFLRLHSKAFNSATRLERQDLLEQFESLRRTYGKRS